MVQNNGLARNGHRYRICNACIPNQEAMLPKDVLTRKNKRLIAQQRKDAAPNQSKRIHCFPKNESGKKQLWNRDVCSGRLMLYKGDYC